MDAGESNKEETEAKMIEQEQFVYLCCMQHLCRINLSKLFCSDTSSSSPPPFEVVVDFVEKDLPIEMSRVVLDDSKLYMVGGRKLGKSPKIYDFIMGDVSYRCKGLNMNVFAFDPSNLSKPFYPSEVISKMQAPKTNPIVAAIDGKTYVLPGWPHYTRDNHLLPSFEVYDPATNSWEALPDPPYYDSPDSFRSCVTITHFVFRRKLFIFISKCPVFYNIDARVWECARSFLNQFPALSAPFFSGNTCHVAEYDGFLIAFADDKLVAYNFDPDNNLKSYRVLEELKDLFDPPWDASMGFVIHLGQGKMCFLLSGYLKEASSPKIFRVSTFQVCSREDVADDHFPVAVVLTNLVYNTGQLPHDIDFIRDVFVLYEVRILQNSLLSL